MYAGVSVFHLSSNQARNKLVHRVSRKDSGALGVIAGFFNLQLVLRLADRFIIVVNATRLVAAIFLHKRLSIECLAYFVIVRNVSANQFMYSTVLERLFRALAGFFFGLSSLHPASIPMQLC